MLTAFMNKRPLTAEIWSIFRLFGPIIVGQLASCAISVTDTVMAGAAGTIELSGVALGTAFFNPVQMSLCGLTLAIPPIVGQLKGAGRMAMISKRMWSAMWICLCASVLFAVLLLMLRQLFFILPSDPKMIDVAARYTLWTAAAMPGIAMMAIVRSYSEGLGHTRPTLIFGLTMLALNIPLNYICIFGKLGLPAMGGEGCGAASCATFYITALLFCIYVKKARIYEGARLFVKSYGITLPAVRSYLKIGIPICLSLALEVSCFALGALILSPFGPITVASHSIALNISGMIFMVPLSLAAALTIRIGHSVGARDLNLIKKVIRAGYTLTLIFVVIFLTVLYFGRSFFVQCYTGDSEVIAYASLILLYCCIYQLPDSLQMASIGILRGFKDTRIIMYGTLIAYWLIAIPLGYVLAYGIFTRPMQAIGIWIGFIAGLTASAMMYLYRVRRICKNPAIVGMK